MIRALTFGISCVFVRLLSLLPFAVLDVISRLLYFLLNKVIHYREKVILGNLGNAFPEKSENEIQEIKSAFYRYFSRLLIENIRMFHMSLSRLEKHIELVNPEVLENYYRQGISVAAIAAHYGNWEWLLGLRKAVPHHSVGIYKPLNNRYFNRFFTRHRSKYGTEIINMREVPRVLLNYSRMDVKTLTVFISDQSPVWEEIQYWTRFLNQETPVYLGPEKLARKMKMAVIYFRVKVEPGHHYKVTAIPVTDDASQLQDFEITEKHLALLEEDIRNCPQYWLWSHRRWKLRDKRKAQEEQGIFRFEGNFRKK